MASKLHTSCIVDISGACKASLEIVISYWTTGTGLLISWGLKGPNLTLIESTLIFDSCNWSKDHRETSALAPGRTEVNAESE